MELIQHFFTDVISRVIPGSIVIFLYFGSRVKAAVSGSHEQAILALICLAASAWLVGVILEIITFTLPLLLLKFFRRGLKRAKDEWSKWLYNKLERLHNSLALAGEKPWKDDSAFGRRVLKLSAEKILFRHMLVISLWTLVYPPPALPTYLHWQWWYSVAGFLTFLLGWLLARVQPPTGDTSTTPV